LTFTFLIYEVEPDCPVLHLSGLDGHVPHLPLPVEREAVVADEGLRRWNATQYLKRHKSEAKTQLQTRNRENWLLPKEVSG
jgi:hypothetical protein